jgi:hypothetical protein
MQAFAGDQRIFLGSRSQKRSFGFLNQDYGTGVIEVVFP